MSKQEKRLTQKEKREQFVTIQNYLRAKAESHRKKEATELNKQFISYDLEEY